MKLRLLPVLLLVAAAALLAGACSQNRVERPPAHPATATPSGGPTADDSGDASATPTEAPGLLEAALLSALLTSEDLGNGWTRVDLDSTTKGSLPATTGQDGYCGQATAEAEALDGYLAAAWTAYERPGDGFEASQELVSYPADEAEPAFDRYVEFLRACESWTKAGGDGASLQWTVRGVTDGTIAHESVYVQMEIGDGGAAGQARMIVWRRGTVISIMTLMNTSPDGSAPVVPETVLTLLQNRLRFTVNLNQ